MAGFEIPTESLHDAYERGKREERERCAQLAERLYEKPGWSPHYKNAAKAIADLIRRS